MRRLLASVLALLAGAAAASVPNVQTIVTDLAGRGGTGGCPTFAAPPDGSTFFLDPLSAPAGVAVDPGGKLYVSTSGNCVWRLDADGLLRMGFIDSGPFRIGSGSAGFGDGDATTALLNNPMKLALDSSGDLYIADTSNQRIRKVNTATWTISTIAGGGSLRPIDGIRATDASFLFPVGVAVDATGNVYVSDSNAAKVFKVDTNGILSRFAGSGAFTYNGENIPATSAAMIPMGLAVDESGDVFIADWSNSIVRKVTPDGNITTVAGNPFNSTFLGDGGPAFGAALSKPRGVAVDASGDVFIADTEHHRIRMVDISGIITTVAGNGIAGSDTGELNFPTAVAVDNLGNIFIADTVNNKLRGVIVSQRTYRLTLNGAGTGSGTLNGAGSYVVGQFVPVSATPDFGSSFISWSGPSAAECASGTVLMDADKSCTATFTSARDTTPPVLSGVPVSFTVNTTSPGGTAVTYALPTATDPDDPAGPVTCNPPSGSIFPIGSTTVTCTSTDTHGNTGSASFTVTVALASANVSIVVSEPIAVSDDTPVTLPIPLIVEESIAVLDGDGVAPDSTPPVFSGVPASITVPATGIDGAIVTYTQPTASDPDDPAGPVTCAPASGSVFPIGTTTVTCTSTDSHGNKGTASFPVNVTVVAPVASIVDTELISVGDSGGAVSGPTPIVVQESIAVNDNPTLPAAVTLVLQEPISVADSDSASVPDTTPPVLALPASITVDATGPAGAVVTFAATATDPDDPAGPVTCAPASESAFPIGVTVVSCSASDSHGNTATGAFDVVVLSPAQIVGDLITAAAAAGWPQASQILLNAAWSITQQSVSGACGQVSAFANQVSAQAGKMLTAAQAADLLRHASNLKATLGCR